MPHQSRPSAAAAFFLPAAIFLVASIGISMAYFRHFLINHDVAYFLFQSARMIEGDQLYADIIDFNPPMIHLWGILPVLISHVTHWPVAAVFYSYTSLVLLGVLALCIPITSVIYRQLPLDQRLFLVLSLAFCLFPLALADFGQREHLFFALFLPYLLLSFARSTGSPPSRTLSLIAGFLAAIGLCFKPFFLLPFLAVELFAFAHNRKSFAARRWDIAIITAVMTIYLGSILFVFPRYVDCILVAKSLYSGYDTTMTDLITKRQVVLYAAILMIYLIPKPRSGNDRLLCRLLLLVMGSFLLMALVQKKGWDYQYYPLLALEAFLAIFLLLRRTEIWNLSRSARLMVPGTLLLILSGITLFMGVPFLDRAAVVSNTESLKSSLLPLVKKYAKDRPMYVLSTSLYPGWIMVLHSGARWPYRHASLWFLPGIYRSRMNILEGAKTYNEPGTMGSMERLFFTQVVSDLVKRPPSLLMIDRRVSKQGLTGAFDYATYFSQDKTFAELLGGYRRAASIESFDFYVPGGSPEPVASLH